MHRNLESGDMILDQGLDTAMGLDNNYAKLWPGVYTWSIYFIINFPTRNLIDLIVTQVLLSFDF